MQCLKYRAFSTPECANVLDGSINYTFILSSPSGTSHPSTGATPTYYSISEATSDARQAVRARYRGATTIRVAACRQVTSTRRHCTVSWRRRGKRYRATVQLRELSSNRFEYRFTNVRRVRS